MKVLLPLRVRPPEGSSSPQPHRSRHPIPMEPSITVDCLKESILDLMTDHYSSYLGVEFEKETCGETLTGRIDHYDVREQQFHVEYTDGIHEKLPKGELDRYLSIGAATTTTTPALASASASASMNRHNDASLTFEKEDDGFTTVSPKNEERGESIEALPKEEKEEEEEEEAHEKLNPNTFLHSNVFRWDKEDSNVKVRGVVKYYFDRTRRFLVQYEDHKKMYYSRSEIIKMITETLREKTDVMMERIAKERKEEEEEEKEEKEEEKEEEEELSTDFSENADLNESNPYAQCGKRTNYMESIKEERESPEEDLKKDQKDGYSKQWSDRQLLELTRMVQRKAEREIKGSTVLLCRKRNVPPFETRLELYSTVFDLVRNLYRQVIFRPCFTDAQVELLQIQKSIAPSSSSSLSSSFSDSKKPYESLILFIRCDGLQTIDHMLTIVIKVILDTTEKNVKIDCTKMMLFLLKLIATLPGLTQGLFVKSPLKATLESIRADTEERAVYPLVVGDVAKFILQHCIKGR